MSLPETLLDEFDNVLSERGYRSRSKGIRDALNSYILRYEGINEPKCDKIGIISIVYDYHCASVMKNLVDARQKFEDYINVSMHVYLTDNHCLEVLIVNGDISKIKDLIENMRNLKCITNIKLLNTHSKSYLTP